MSMHHRVSVTTFPENAGSSRPIWVNDVELHTLAYNIDSRTGLANTAGLRGANAEPPGRDGVLWTPGKPADTLTVRLSMWASPVRPDGSRPATEAEAYDNWRSNQDMLNALFDSRISLLTLKMQTSSGEIRQAMCEVTKAIDPEVQLGHMSNFEVELEVVGSYWEDLDASVWTSPTGTAAVGTHEVTILKGSTAPNSDLICTVTGPISNPRITDVKSGHYVQLSQTLATGATWTVNSMFYTSTAPNGSTQAIENLVTSGLYNPRFMVISPGFSAAPKITLSGSGAGGATKLLVAGRRKYR